MDQSSAEMRANYPRLIKAGSVIMIKIMAVLVVLAFLHNLFAVDIHINHAKHEFNVQLVLNDCQHASVDKALKLAAHYLLPRGLVDM
jgi:hypothetical protein